MIFLENLSKKFENETKFAVNNISLTVNAGELLVILGSSGSGKSTLLKMINGLVARTEGRILINNKPIEDYDPIKLRRRIGYVFQHVGLFPHMTIEDNINVSLRLSHYDKKSRKARIRELLSQMQLDDKIYGKRFPRELSGGQCQRVGIARAMALSPKIFLMDEPFAACDPITREQLQNEVLILKEKLKATIIFVTHDVQEAFRLGDRIAIMDKGVLQQIDTTQNLKENPANSFVETFLTVNEN